MKENLLIVSDMFGGQPSWLHDYIGHFEKNFSVSYFDCKKEAGIPDQVQTPEEIHQRFILGGLAHGVQQLLKLQQSPTQILAFSMGGTLAWKAQLQGLPCTRLCCVSATRLRYETEKPNCPVHLIYGSLDENRPETEWFEQQDIKPNVIADKGHDFYRKASSIIPHLSFISK